MDQGDKKWTIEKYYQYLNYVKYCLRKLRKLLVEII